MIFPSLDKIATLGVATIPSTVSINEALDKLLQSNHHLIIIDHHEGEKYCVLTVNDVIEFQINEVNFENSLSTLPCQLLPTLHKGYNILEVIELINETTPYIGVLDDNDNLIGIVTHHDILSSIDPKMLIERLTLKELFHRNSLATVSPDTTVSLALHLMKMHQSDSIIAVVKNQPIGILTTKDIAKLLLEQKDLEVPLSFYMTSPIDTLNEDATVKDALDFLLNKNYRRIIVVDNNNFALGIITRQEIISIAFSRWSDLVNRHAEEITELNRILQIRTERLEKMASYDKLTGIPNRRKFEEILEIEIERFNRYGDELSIIFFDIDHFKSINDTYGHTQGDKVLYHIAQVVKNSIRICDFIARWGGEEFVVLLPATSLQNSLLVAEKIRSSVEKVVIDGMESSVTCSFGVSSFVKGENSTVFIERADHAMYEAKNSGRNCIRSIK